MIKMDLHIHSHHSPDGNMNPMEIIDLAKKSGLDVISITDHNTTRGSKEAIKLLGNSNTDELKIFIGQEVKTKQGDLLVYNIEKDIEPHLDVEEVCRIVKKQKGIIIAPHPFDTFRCSLTESIFRIIKYLDGIEGLNARCYLNKFNEKAAAIAKQHKIPAVANTDSHFKEELGKAMTITNAEKTANLKTLIEGSSQLVGKSSGLMPHVKTFLVKLGYGK